MARVSDLLRWLAGRPSHCRHCGDPLLALIGGGLVAVVCPSCDVTPGTLPRSAASAPGADRPSALDHAEHHVSITGCSECADQSWFRGRRAG